MTNHFACYGKIISGNHFIGRKNEIQLIQNRFLAKNVVI
jgi:hypothetical protein